MQQKMDQLFRELRVLAVKEVRFNLSYYLEIVLPMDQLGHVTSSLDRCFGGPVDPGGSSNWADIEEFINYYGGIRPDQILYYQREGGEVFYAMIWPWSDRTSMTVRVESVKE